MRVSVRRPKLEATLKKVGLRATVSRLAVLRELIAANAPRTHAEITARLAGAELDRATIYRNLIDFTEAGLVRRTDLGDHVWRFEAVESGEGADETGHAHLICRECGSISCLPDGALELSLGEHAPSLLRQKGLTLHLNGLCEACL
jgi:Fur family ferric uptake transcriptional regulator